MDKMDKINKITDEKLAKYFEVTESAYNKAKEAIADGKEKEAEEILDMVKRYIDDAKFFKEKGEYVNAFAALNYSHGWLDTGSRLGIFNVTDSDLFVIK